MHLPAGSVPDGCAWWRSKRIRRLRAEFHPDRHPGTNGSMQAVLQEVSSIVNSRTEVLLQEDDRITV